MRPGQIAVIEENQDLSLPILGGYVTYLRRARRFDEADRLRNLAAAAALATFPVSDDAALADAGRLLRYVRYLIPVVSADRMARRLGFRGQRNRYHEAEKGEDALSFSELERFASIAEREGIFDRPSAAGFVGRLKEIYRARGLDEPVRF